MRSFGEQSLTVVFFTPVVTFHFVTDLFTFKTGDFLGIDQQAWSPRKEMHIRHKSKHFCKQHAMLQIPWCSLVSRLVGLSTVEGSRSVVFGGGGESLPPLLPAGRLSADYCYPTATHPPPSSSSGVGARDGHAVNTLAIFFLLNTPTSLQELQGWSCCQ